MELGILYRELFIVNIFWPGCEAGVMAGDKGQSGGLREVHLLCPAVPVHHQPLGELLGATHPCTHGESPG